MPLVRNLGDGLWEVRTYLLEKVARTIFCIREDQIILLHGFIKKTNKIPQKELALAKQRLSRLRG